MSVTIQASTSDLNKFSKAKCSCIINMYIWIYKQKSWPYAPAEFWPRTQRTKLQYDPAMILNILVATSVAHTLTYIHTLTHSYVYTCTHKLTHTYVHIWLHTYILVFTVTCIYTFLLASYRFSLQIYEISQIGAVCSQLEQLLLFAGDHNFSLVRKI